MFALPGAHLRRLQPRRRLRAAADALQGGGRHRRGGREDQAGDPRREQGVPGIWSIGVGLLRGSCKVSMFIHKQLDQRKACSAF